MKAPPLNTLKSLVIITIITTLAVFSLAACASQTNPNSNNNTEPQTTANANGDEANPPSSYSTDTDAIQRNFKRN